MRATILFGGNCRERLVSVSSTQAIAEALPEADLWFWDADDSVRAVSRADLLTHQRPFEIPFTAAGAPLGQVPEAVARAGRDDRVLVLALHGGPAENGALQALCEAHGVAFTGSGAAASRLAFDKVATKAAVAAVGIVAPAAVALDDIADGLARHGRLIAKPIADGSSFGLIFIDDVSDIAALRTAAADVDYLVEPFVSGAEATCGVLERDGRTFALPPVEIIPAEGVFDYSAKYLAAATQEICPARFAPDVNSAIQAAALKAHLTVGATGYSRSDFVVTPNGPVFLEINTLPGLTRASLLPKALAADGIGFADFLHDQIALAIARVGKSA